MYSEAPDIFEAHTSQSATAATLDQLALSGATPPKDEQDTRPMPTEDHARHVVEAMFVSIQELFEATCLDDQATDLMWQIASAFHRKLGRLETGFDQLAFEMRRALRDQDGSEIRTTELERLQNRAHETSEAVQFFQVMRDHAAESFGIHTGQPWRPTGGSLATRSPITASIIDSREFLAAADRKKVLDLAPEGPRVLIAGGTDYQDTDTIFQALDAAHKKYPDMVLIHGGASKGCDLIASKWAKARKVAQIVFKPDWSKHGKSRAGFVRNDQMIAANPIGALIFPGSGLTQNLADKAKAACIRVKVYR